MSPGGRAVTSPTRLLYVIFGTPYGGRAWDPTARLLNPGNPTSSIQQNIVMECGSLRSQTDFRILESQIGVLTDLLLCGWDLSTSEAAYTAVAGSSSSQSYSSSRSPVAVQNIFEPL